MARDEQLKERWEGVVQKLSAQFSDGDPLDLDAIIYLIGVQELGQIHRRFKKDEKINLSLGVFGGRRNAFAGLTGRFAPARWIHTFLVRKYFLDDLYERKVFPIFLIFAIIMSGLYLGFFTATESAAVGVILVLIFIFARGQLTLNLLKEALWTTIKTVGSLYLIVIGASIFNYLITVTQLPFAVVDFINYLELTPLGIILVICVIYLSIFSLHQQNLYQWFLI